MFRPVAGWVWLQDAAEWSGVQPSASARVASPVLYIKTRFRHSKLQPLKQEIYDVQAHQRKIQRDATNLKHGKPTEYDWDWPEDVVASRRRSARRSIGRRGAAELEIGDGDGGVV